MLRKRSTSLFIAGLLAFMLSFGCVAAMITGMGLNAKLFPMALGCALVSAGCVAAAAFRRGGWICWCITGMMVTLSLLFFPVRQLWCSMLGTMFDYYDRAYHIGIPVMFDVSRLMGHGLPLLMVATFVAMIVSMTILRRWPTSLAVFLALLPLATCFVVTDTVPELWSLLLWFYGVVMMLMTHPVRQRSSSQGNQLTAVLALPVALGLGLLLIFAPQEGFQPTVRIDSVDSFVGWLSSKLPFVGQTYSGELVFSFGGGFFDRVDLEHLGERNLSNTPVLELESDFSGKVYLRAVDMDRYDGLSWSASRDREEDDFALPKKYRTELGSLQIRVLGSRGYRYVPYWPQGEVTFVNGQLPNEDYDRTYSYDVVRLKNNWKYLLSTGSGGGLADDIYLDLPADTADDAMQILWEAGIYAGGNTASLAERIGDYVKNSAEYNLDPDVMPDSQEDLAIWFLQEADRGYCVHFATAAAVLLRAAGIPARYVEGYTADLEADEVTVVRANKAHAWVEYYVAGVGWVILDPTPAASSSTETTDTTQTTETESTVTDPVGTESGPTEPSQTESEPTEPSQTESGPTEPSQTESEPTEPSGTHTTDATDPTGTESVEPQPTQSAPTQPPDTPGGQKKSLPGWVRGVLIGMAVLAGMVLAVIGQWQLRRRWTLYRMKRGSLNDQALATYRQIRRMVKVRKLKVPAGLKKLAEKACYSRQGITPEELKRFRESYRRCAIALKNESWYKKLYYRLVLALI